MIKSMTGYGTGSAEYNGKTFTIEIKSVNSRYSDFSIKLPRIYIFLEDVIRKAASEKIKRGKVDIFFNVENNQKSGEVVTLNAELARSYHNALLVLSEELGIPCSAKAETFLRLPDIFTVEAEDEDADEISKAVLEALSAALEGYDKMRQAEGAKLYEDLCSHLTFIENATTEIENYSPNIVTAYQKRLEERMRETLGNTEYDEARLMTEVAIFSDKVNTNEETVRLKSHTEQFRQMLASSDAVGRKIDFLIQEMNREINTIGSKSNDLTIARIVIDVKAEIEKLREQIQNIE